MNYKKLGNSDLEVSVIGLGTWGIGSEFYGKVDDAQSIATIRKGIESGINLIDTAPAYGKGHSEEVVGKAIEGYRDEVIIATKVGTYKEGEDFFRDLSPEAIRKQIERSLSRLNIDVIDLYQIHWPDPDTPLEESVKELVKLKKEGKFKYLGVSNFGTSLMEEIQEMTDIVSLQPQYSILNRDIEEEILPYTRKNNIGVLAYGPLGGGILTGKYTDTDEAPQLKEDDKRNEFYPFFQEPKWSQVKKLVQILENIAEDRGVSIPQVSLNWVRQQNGVTSVLVGAKNPEQAAENAAAADWNLTETEIEKINKAYKEIIKN
ncbi:MAG: aldo/keto reductase [bacterium]